MALESETKLTCPMGHLGEVCACNCALSHWHPMRMLRKIKYLRDARCRLVYKGVGANQ